jgi:hypothetical protein
MRLLEVCTFALLRNSIEHEILVLYIRRTVAEKKWCRRRESEYPGLLKTHKLLVFRDAKNAEHGRIAPNWNVSGT